jgi:molybdopterin-guanine dinucleotide biosynthesis protein A
MQRMDALILAGGENKRIPLLKGFLEIRDGKILEVSIQRLRKIFNRIILSTNTPEHYYYLGLPMVGDIIQVRGPMTGIFSALSLPDVSAVFVTACDMPDINGILIKYISGRWGSGYDAVIPVFNNEPQPLLGVYAKSLLRKMEEALYQEKRSLRGFLRNCNVFYIQEADVRKIDPEGRSFVNINTMQDFKKETGGKKCLV